MQLQELWSILARRWWIVFLVGALAGGSAYTFSKMQEPVYVSTSKLFVMPARPDYGLFSQAIINQYSQLLGSDKYLKSASEKLTLALPLEAVRGKVRAFGKPQDLTITLEVRDNDPQRGKALAHQVALDFIQDQDARMKDVDKENRIDVRMYDESSVNRVDFPKTRTNVASGSLLGLLVGAIIAFFIEYLDDTIKSVEDVDRHIGLPVLGSIPGFRSQEV